MCEQTEGVGELTQVLCEAQDCHPDSKEGMQAKGCTQRSKKSTKAQPLCRWAEEVGNQGRGE